MHNVWKMKEMNLRTYKGMILVELMIMMTFATIKELGEDGCLGSWLSLIKYFGSKRESKMWQNVRNLIKLHAISMSILNSTIEIIHKK